MQIRLDALPGRESSFYEARCDLKQLVAVSSHPDVVLSTKASHASTAAHDRVTIKAKSQHKNEASQRFYITLYGDAKQARPVETWQVQYLLSHSAV